MEFLALKKVKGGLRGLVKYFTTDKSKVSDYTTLFPWLGIVGFKVVTLGSGDDDFVDEEVDDDVSDDDGMSDPPRNGDSDSEHQESQSVVSLPATPS